MLAAPDREDAASGDSSTVVVVAAADAEEAAGAVRLDGCFLRVEAPCKRGYSLPDCARSRW